MKPAPEGRRLVATGGASKASATRGRRRQHGFRPGGAEVGCHGWSERRERNPWKASPTWIPPRRGGGWLPRVERAQRAQPVESVANMDSAPEGRRNVATGEASATSATRGKRRRYGDRPGGAEVGCHG